MAAVAVVLSLVALAVASASIVLGSRREQSLRRQLDLAAQESVDRLATATGEVTARFDDTVQAAIADFRLAQSQVTDDALREWSVATISEVEALLGSLRATVKTDTIALISDAIAAHLVQQANNNRS